MNSLVEGVQCVDHTSIASQDALYGQSELLWMKLGREIVIEYCLFTSGNRNMISCARQIADNN